MDSFSLLKFWKGGAATSSTVSGIATPPPPPPTTTTIITSSTDSNSDSEPDAGPFFDLEFALPSESEDEHVNESTEEDEEEEVEEVKLTNDDDVYIRGQIVEINGSDEEQDTVGTTKSGQFPIPVSLLRSATKLRVLMLGLKKSKTESTSKSNQQNNTKKLFTVKLKFKTDENPIISLLTRNTSNSKQNTTTAGEEEKKEKKEMVQRYLRMLYEKAKAAKMKKKGVGVGKKKETAVVHSMPLSSSNSNNGGMSVRSGSSGGGGGGGGSKRRDDSLLQIQDGIQGAILHCKRSFNSSTAHEELEVEPSVVEREPSTTEETAAAAAASYGDGRNGIAGI